MRTVLLVEDQKETIHLVQTILSTRNIHVVATSRALEGIELMRESLPDLVLMDLLLPEVDGFEAIEIIRADETLKDVPIIAFTAASIANVHHRLKEVGADAFIHKPFKVPELLKIVEGLLP